MAAKRCGVCNINYPMDTKPDRCRSCGGDLLIRHNEEPDKDWHDLVIHKLRHPQIEWEGAHPKTDALVSVLNVPLAGGETVTFIPHQELIDMGYMSLEDFDIVRVNGRFFELQGFNEPVEAWWVEEIQLPEEESDTGQSLEAMGEGGSESPGGDEIRPAGE